MGKVFKKGLDKDDQKEGLFKRPKIIENAQKNLIRDGDNESIYYTPRSEVDDKDNKDEKQQTNNIDTKSLNVFNYLKSLSQEANDLMDEIEEANDDIDIYKVLFIVSNKKNFNFNILIKIPLIFLSAIYNGEISLKEAEISQRKIEMKIEELKFNYKLKNEEEKEKINGVLMQANDLLEYRDKIIKAFKDGTFLSEYFKKSDDAAHDYVLKDVMILFRKLNQWKKKLTYVCSGISFELLSADYAKILINIKTVDENKKIIEEIEYRTSYLKDRIKTMSEKEKKIKMRMIH